MTGSRPHGVVAAGVLIVDRHWPWLVVALVLAAAVGGVAAIGDDAAGTESAHAGELRLDVESAAEPQTDEAVTLPADGVIVGPGTQTLRVRLAVPDGTDDIAGVDVELRAARTVAAGTLWTLHEPVDSLDVGASSTTVRLASLHDRLDALDRRLGTDSGDITLEVAASAVDEQEQTIAEVTTPVEVREDHLVVQTPATEPITSSSPTSTDRSTGAVLTTVMGVTGAVALGSLRMTGAVPLTPSRRRRYQLASVRWRHRRQVVERSTPIETDTCRRLGDIAAVARVARQSRRPIEVDPTGAVAVTVDGVTYAWWPPR